MLLTYLLRSNSDVTSLLSGTTIKAIVAYIFDYVTKPGLKTYSIFDTITSVFARNSEMIEGNAARKEQARVLITQIVNSMTPKMEIGGPMASLYLVGNPDHYTDHDFVVFYWKSYVTEVLRAWKKEEDQDHAEKIMLNGNADGEYVGVSVVDDYKYRPYQLKDKSLYEWIPGANRTKWSKSAQKHFSTQQDELDVIDSTSDVKPHNLQQRKVERLC